MKKESLSTDYSNAVALTYDSWAATYDDINEFTSYTAHEVVADLAQKHAPGSVGSILDLATGTGFVLNRLRETFRAVSMTGLDISKNMLEQARKNTPGSTFAVCNMETQQWPVPKDSIDLVTCAGALSMIGNMDHVMDECRRVMAPNAAAVMSFQIRTDFSKGMGFVRSAASSFPTFCRTPEEMEAIVLKHGFTPTESQQPFSGYKGHTFHETHGAIAFRKS